MKGKNTAYFGPLTLKALISYQKDNNILPATGYFGPMTMNKINNHLTISPKPTTDLYKRDLELGMTGEDIRSLQKELNRLGYTVSETGPGSIGMETNMFGKATRNALIKYQKSKKIIPSIGYFGPITRESINIK